jgi:tetratricopeptide (TPR) repeat protein
MRIVAAALAASLTLIVPPHALGQEAVAPLQDSGSRATAEKPEPLPPRAQRLDELFATLKAAPDQSAAKRAENGIMALWLESGSDTVDLLMVWSLKAIDDKDYPRALDFLDRVVTMKPDYAEGWNKRATVFYLTENYSQAVADIQRALIAEPRHFGALSGLGSILREIGADKKAIEAYNQALALDPYLDGVKKALGELEKETHGNDI